MAFRGWPAPITGKETLQLILLLGSVAVAAVVAFGSGTQSLTPISMLWVAPWGLTGAALGWRLGTILSRVNRDYNPRGVNVMATWFAALAVGLLFCGTAWSIAVRYSFRDGGAASIRSFPVIKVTHGKYDSERWAVIDPFGLPMPRGAMIPLSQTDYWILASECGADCGGRICIEAPIETAPDGSVRLMMGDSAYQPPPRSLSHCNGEQIVVTVLDGNSIR